MKRTALVILAILSIVIVLFTVACALDDLVVGNKSGVPAEGDADHPPSTNFDFTHWKLTLPTAGAAEVSPYTLRNGYTNKYFYTLKADGSVTFWTPVTGGCTSGTKYPRTELRELINPSNDNINWPYSGTHILNAEERVSQVPSSGKVIVLQIHGFDARPLVKVQWNNNNLEWLVKEHPSGDNGDQKYTFSGVGSVRYKAQIKVVDGVLYMTVNGTTQTHDFVAVDAEWKNVNYYFKAGSYCQDNEGSSSEGSRVHIYSLSVSHS